MCLKNMPRWFRGGTLLVLIFLILFLITSLIEINCSRDQKVPEGSFLLCGPPKYYSFLTLIPSLIFFSSSSSIYLLIIISGIIYFIIGAIIGFIIGKFKSKKVKKQTWQNKKKK